MTSSKSQWDGRTKHVHFPGVNKECMQYITHMMKFVMNVDNIELCEDKMTMTKAKKVCHPNLSVSHKKRKYSVQLLRVVEEDELDLLRSVLGSTFGVGLTHSAPSMKAIKKEKQETGKDISTVELLSHQIVRIVTCKEQDINSGVEDADSTPVEYEPYDKSHPQKRIISSPGCDLFYEESTITNFHVALRFKKLKGNALTVVKAMNGGVEVRTPANEIMTVTDGNEFRYDNAIYRVKTVADGYAKCIPTWKTQTTATVRS